LSRAFLASSAIVEGAVVQSWRILVRCNNPCSTKPQDRRKAKPQDVFCSTKPSWQGGSLRAPVASPRPWLCQGIDPIQSQQNVSPFHHSRETSLSLHPSTWRAFLPPRPLTTPLRPLHGDQRGEHSRYPSLEPSHRPKSVSHPLEPRPTLRGLDAAILPKMDHSRGSITAPKPSSSALEFLSTETEP